MLDFIALNSGAGLDFLIHPKEFKAAGGDLHQRLKALMIVPKRKKVAAKKAVEQKLAETQDPEFFTF